MAEPHVQHLWPLDGISDLPANYEELAVSGMRAVEQEWEAALSSLKGSPALEEFTLHLQREWAIETGQIENLYDLERGVTIALINNGFQAALIPHGGSDKDPQYVLNLLNDQQSALEGLFAFVRQDRHLSTSYIRELHAAMCRSQESVVVQGPDGRLFETELIKGDWKKLPNHPKKDDSIIEFCPPEHVQSEMDRLVEFHLAHVKLKVPPEVEAAWLHHRFVQIHPFQDGNGRVARALASLIYIRASLFPLVVPVTEKSMYLEVLEAADNGNLRPFILLNARLQQGRFRKAMRTLTRNVPPLDTPEAAARQLARFLAHEDETRTNRLSRRVQELSTSAHGYLEGFVKASVRIMRDSDPGVSSSQSPPVQLSGWDPVRVLSLENHYGVSLGPPAFRSSMELRIKRDWSIVLLSCIVSEDPSEEIRLIPYLLNDGIMHILPVGSFDLIPGNYNYQEQLKEFVSAVTAVSLNEIRMLL